MATPPTFGFQSTLPRLPVPSLKSTCSLYLHSLLPYQTAEEHEKSKKIVHDFMNSTLAASLQQRLIDIDNQSPHNWLEDNFWMKKAYLEQRKPLMINSNWFILAKETKAHPKELLQNDSQGLPEGQFSYFQIHMGASCIDAACKYIQRLENETIPVDMVQGQPLCMEQCRRFFGLCRIPQAHCDAIVQKELADITHVIVMACDQLYKLQVFEFIDGKKQQIHVSEVEKALLAIASHASNQVNAQKPISLLTSWDRDHWAVARNHLLTLDPVGNRQSLSDIETALYVLCLDDYTQGSGPVNWSKTGFCGPQNRGHGHNRWFDKTISLIIENNGQGTVMGEHTPSDAAMVGFMVYSLLFEKETCLQAGETKPAWLSGARAPVGPPSSPLMEHLLWTTDSVMEDYLKQAQEAATILGDESDPCNHHFRGYGSEWIKRIGKMPPDSFMQIVLQLAYYRVHRIITATYETASTRKFFWGRTETIRSCSMESKQFVEKFDDPHTSDQAAYDMLLKAVAAHRKYSQLASQGQGCDRHLSVLQLLNQDHVMADADGLPGQQRTPLLHPIFTDPVFTTSQTWRLSTSALMYNKKTQGSGFGTPFKQGYGINYMISPDFITMGIETKKGQETLSAQKFAEVVSETLEDIRATIERILYTELWSKDRSKL
ncbi:acyltransferase ChoActase/COT/CPT [Absidia repens]|uniref:Acyltransferase ChoActase/COT/CPT n=1 Tax=Absidia repens TaxID=90262 RepID=A0A1X2I8Q7_9FUNG|nr:acyltransferase ChoActase/COT/CPT [Absidia repens]